MLFNSFQFFLFFPTVTILYFLCPHPTRWLLLLLASCFFYMAFIPAYIFILFILIIIDYFAGRLIESAEGKNRLRILVVSIFANCGVLFAFKYFNFFNATLAGAARLLNWDYSVANLSIILPIGLSFHTFQSLSYVIEVYRRKQKAERHIGIYALYVLFYPQLVAGPIERPGNLLHQFHEKHFAVSSRIVRGLQIMLWGLFKKVVIADRIAPMVDQVYQAPAQYQGLPLIVATVLFAFQIYCDFSGYSDIAIGAAEVMGFKLMRNFNRPYFSKSIAEFWRRWHISLSTWFKDYLYTPLGGSRVPAGQWRFNLFFTFLVSGLWHGASWTFVIWGALNGFYIIFSAWTKPARRSLAEYSGLHRFPGIHRSIQIGITFALTCFAWIFFRARTAQDAFYIASHLCSGLDLAAPLQMLKNEFFQKNADELVLAVCSIGLMQTVYLVQRKGSVRDLFAQKPLWFKVGAYTAMFLSIILFGKIGGENNRQFIYFQF